MHYIVLDLEATCWEERNSKKQNEIIEIGAVCVNENKKIIDEFDILVRPSIHLYLSDFCTQLTSITQEMIADAPFFPEALQKFQEWIYQFDKEYFLCSWGFYDKSQFEKDCQLHQISTDWLKNHISLKHQHAKIVQAKRAFGMKSALEYEKLNLEGTHHRGIDDAKNITKIFLKHFDNWTFE